MEDVAVDVDADGQLTDEELVTSNRWEPVGEVLSHRVTGLFNGRTYYFRVRAGNHNGEGNGSNDASATPEAPLSAPGNSRAHAWQRSGRADVGRPDPLYDRQPRPHP